MAKEVEMKDSPVEAPATNKPDAKKAEVDMDPEEALAKKCEGILAECIAILENAVTYKETKLLAGRVLRKTASIRKDLNAKILRAFITDTLPAGSAPVALLLNSLSKVAVLLPLTAMSVELKEMQANPLPSHNLLPAYMICEIHHRKHLALRHGGES